MLSNVRSMRNSLAAKLSLIVGGMAFVAAVSIGSTAFLTAQSNLRSEAEARLMSVVEGRRVALANYMDSIRADLDVQSRNPIIGQALEAFTLAWSDLPGDQTRVLQHLYIEENPHPTGQKEKLDAADDGSMYSVTHARYHPWLRRLLQQRGYYDIFLFDPSGNLVYTVFKELDYATNLVHGEYADTDLGNAFRAARDNPRDGFQAFFDFKPYAPSHGAPASFISAPILDEFDRLDGVLVFQMPIDKINEVMQVTAGLGATGDSYIVGADKLMRSDSRHAQESTILKRSVDNAAIERALTGDSGTFETHDQVRDAETVLAFTSLEFQGTRWAIAAQQDASEMLEPVAAMRNQMLINALIALLVLVGLGVFFGRSFSRPIAAMTGAMRALADGDHSVEVPARDRGDEIGLMAAAVEVFKQNAAEMKNMEGEREQAGARAEAEKKQSMTDMADRFEQQVTGVIEGLNVASQNLETNASAMSEVANQASAQSSSVASAAQEASANVQAVASAAEELSSSVSEIGRQVGSSAEIARGAVQEAEQTNAQVQNLASAAEKIGAVVSLISDIAEQTNLLALNATIEAARAGEAGKGFAVVASEVKSLANQTAKATQDISDQVNAIQSETTDAVQAIQGISETIERINEITSGISAAVEEQGAATQEISKNVQQAAAGTRSVTDSIAGVSDASGRAGETAEEVKSASAALSSQADTLRGQVEQFLNEVRAG
ncbi:MAG: methyl-accepting chemotaxis protein [Alphaproteobacteria bacterium]|nr:methyl-accepting chemotaxis protein [Alphaproteobacteria bacterium]